MSNENSTLIDIGSGDGFFLSKIISKTNFNNYIGVEIEENSHSVAIAVHNGAVHNGAVR